MPKNTKKKTKMKTRSGAKKRFKLTATGKVKFWAAGRRHILTKKKPKRRRHSRGGHMLASTGDAKQIKRLLPYG